VVITNLLKWIVPCHKVYYFLVPKFLLYELNINDEIYKTVIYST